jgi:hypothetical protein
MNDAHARIEDLLEDAHEDHVVFPFALREAADGYPEDDGEHHQRQHLAVERAHGRFERIARDELDEDVAQRFSGSRIGLDGLHARWRGRRASELQPSTWLEHVDQHDADGN